MTWNQERMISTTIDLVAANSNDEILMSDAGKQAVEYILNISSLPKNQIVSTIKTFCHLNPEISDCGVIVNSCLDRLLGFEVTCVSSSSLSSGSSSSSSVLHDYSSECLILSKSETPLQAVLNIFPSADVVHVQKLLIQFGGHVEGVAQEMMEKGFLKRAMQEETKSTPRDFTNSSWTTSPSYRDCALQFLLLDFPFLRVDGVRRFFESQKHHYTPTKLALEKSLNVKARQITKSLNSNELSAMEDGLQNFGLRTKQVTR